jgi:hypothetical protein
MKTCPDCGERVYNLGCVNCNEAAYIDEQVGFDEHYGEHLPQADPAVDPVGELAERDPSTREEKNDSRSSTGETAAPEHNRK